MGECFFWYQPTWVVPDQRPLNGCVYVCVRVGLVFGVFLKVWLVFLCVFVDSGLVYIFMCFCISLDYLGFMLLVTFVGFGFQY